MKKLLGIAACAALALSCLATPVKAAAPINAEEQRLLDYVSTGVEVEGEVLGYPVESNQYQMLVEILSTEGVELTKAEVDTVKDSAKSTITYLTDHYYDEMTPEALAEMINLATPGLQVLGVKVEYDAVKDVLTIKTLSGEVISTIENIITVGDVPSVPTVGGTTNKKLENTGENFTSTYALIGGLAVILAGAGIYTLRKKEALN